jgi:hypothetical protein
MTVALPGERPGFLPERGCGMYTKPAVERFGTLRELTLLGVSGASDGAVVLGIPSAGS